MNNFKSFIQEQTDRPGPIGELTTKINEDSNFPISDDITNEEVRDYLTSHTEMYPVFLINVLDQVWAEYVDEKEAVPAS